VYAVLVAAHVSEPAATKVYGLTPRRLWATTVALLALVSVVIGGLALARPASRFGTACGRFGAIAALVAGLIAVVNWWAELAIANGGPGTGNGVVGGGAALVLGLIASALSGLALAQRRRTAAACLVLLTACSGRWLMPRTRCRRHTCAGTRPTATECLTQGHFS
jgi:Family of unknown function (DUF6223)